MNDVREHRHKYESRWMVLVQAISPNDIRGGVQDCSKHSQWEVTSKEEFKLGWPPSLKLDWNREPVCVLKGTQSFKKPLIASACGAQRKQGAKLIST